MRAGAAVLAGGILSAVLLILSFPKYEFGWLAWIALVPLFLALRGLTPRQAFWLGWGSGTFAWMGLGGWLVKTLHEFGPLPYAISLLLVVLVAAYLGVYTAVFCVLRQRLARGSPLRRVVGAAACWTALEFVRTYAFTGLPWNLLGYTQYRDLALIQVSDLTGVYGLSFLIVLVNAAVVDAFSEPRQAWRPVIVAVLAVGAVLAYGGWRLATLIPAMAQSRALLRVAAIQGNIPQQVTWDPPFRQEIVRRYLELSQAAAQGAEATGVSAVDLIVWPEGATPFFLDREADVRARLASFTRRHRVWLLSGSAALELAPDGRPGLTNSAHLMTPDGTLAGRYDKLHLVPFGEYVPLGRLLFFVSKVVEGVGEYVPGRRPVVFRVADATFSVLICYEVIFPALVRSFVREGTDFLVTITNDAWYGRSSEPGQEFAMAVLRTVEHRVPLVRAANTGISGFVDAAGRIGQTTDLFVPAGLVETIRLGRPSQATVYTAVGDLFAWGCMIYVILMGVIWVRRTTDD